MMLGDVGMVRVGPRVVAGRKSLFGPDYMAHKVTMSRLTNLPHPKDVVASPHPVPFGSIPPPAECARLPYVAAATFAGEEVADRALPDVSAARPASGALSPLA